MRFTHTSPALLLALALASCSNNGEPTPSPPPPIDAIIFSRSDDVFLVKPDGTGLVALANSAAAESYRGFLNGRLLIQRDSDIYSVLPDGTDLRPVVNSPAGESYAGGLGNRVIYLLGPDIDQLKLAIVGLDGSNNVVLTQMAARYALEGVTANRVVYSVLAGPAQYDLYSVLADGTATTPVAATSVSENFITMAGERVIYYHTGGALDIFSVNADGTGRVALAATSDSEQFEGLADGRVIYHKYVGQTTHLMSVRTDGTGEVELDMSGHDVQFAAVAEGRVFYHRKIANNDYDMLSVLPDGTDPRTLAATTSQEFYSGTLGHHVIYACLSNQWDVCVVDDDGTHPLALANSPQAEGFAGTVGDRVIYGRNIPLGIIPQPDVFQVDLASVRIDGTGATTLANSAESEFFVGSSGGRVLFERFANAQRDLYAIDPDGANASTLANSPQDEQVVGTIRY